MIIATDLDGTLANGNKDDILEVMDMFKKHNLIIVYVTGRDIKNFKKLLNTFYKENNIKLMYPDYLICLNGAKIYHKKNLLLKRLWFDRKWTKLIKPGWSKKRCAIAFNKAADKIRFDDNLPSLTTLKYKPSSLYLETAVYHDHLDLIKSTMEEECKKHNTKVNIIFDYIGKNYVDIGIKILDKIDKNKANLIRKMRDEREGLYVMQLSATTKGEAVDYIRKKLKLEREHVLVAGDGGNDYHMLNRGFWSIVVKNAQPLLLNALSKDLSEDINSKVIYTKGEGVKGLIEGINIVLNKSLPHSSDSCLSSVINT